MIGIISILYIFFVICLTDAMYKGPLTIRTKDLGTQRRWMHSRSKSRFSLVINFVHNRLVELGTLLRIKVIESKSPLRR